MSNKPKFDPNQPFEAADAKPPFDPKQPFEAADGSSQDSSLADYLKSALLGTQKGLTAGYAPQAAGRIAEVNPFDKRGYVGARDDLISMQDASKAQNPMTFGTGEALGATLLGILAPGSVPEQSASLLSKLGTAAKTGAGFGLAANPGDTKGEVNPTQLSQRLQNALVGGAVGTGLAGGAAGIRGVGKVLYDAPIQPIEFQGEKMGKTAVNDTLYDLGIKSPIGIRKAVSKLIPSLANEKDAILQQATDAGGQVNMEKALGLAQNKIDVLRASKDPDQHAAAALLEKEIAPLLDAARGKPAIPGTADQTVEQMVPGKGYHGEPIQVKQQTTIPGKPEVPAVPPETYSPKDVNDMASFRYQNASNSAYNQTVKSPVQTNLEKSIPEGMKQEYLNSVEQSLGPDSANQVKDINKKLTALLSTKRAQQAVSNQASRELHSFVSPTGTDKFLLSASSLSDNPHAAGWTMLLKKALDAGKLGSMPAGYYARKLGEKLPELTRNPWLLMNQENGGFEDGK